MSNIKKAFNKSYILFLEWLQAPFPKSKALKREYKRLRKIFDVTPDSDELCRDLDKGFVEQDEKVFQKDPSCLEDIIPFKKMKIQKLYERHLDEGERELFWKNLISLVRCRRMYLAYGGDSHVKTIESMCMDFLSQNPDLRKDPTKATDILLKDMSSEGSFARKLVKEFSQPDTIKSIFANVGSMVRQPGEEKLDFSTILEDTDEKEFESLEENFEEIQEAMRTAGIDPSELLAGHKAKFEEMVGASKKGSATPMPDPMAMLSQLPMRDILMSIKKKAEEKDAQVTEPPAAQDPMAILGGLPIRDLLMKIQKKKEAQVAVVEEEEEEPKEEETSS